MRHSDSWIGGSSRPLADGPRIILTSPVDGSEVTSVGLGGLAEVAAAVASAKAASGLWAAQSATDRGRLLGRVSELLRQHADELIDMECSETGKLRREMAGSLTVAAEYFEYYGGVARVHFGDTMDFGSDHHVFTRREAFGVVGVITPWNGPLTQAARGVAAALAVGNTVVLKPSEFTPSTSIRLAQICEEAGIPAGVMNVVTGSGPDVGTPMVVHPDISLIAFTGSVVTGRFVAKLAAEHFKPTLLELGGKSPNVVFPGADLDRAAASAATICASTGQQCAALSRLIVHEDVEAALLEKVVALLKRAEPGSGLAPLTTEAQFEKVKSYFEIARDDGARLVTGGKVADDGALANGRYVYATVYADVTADMRIFREEIFGPVLAVSRFRTEAEAIQLANDTEYGLVAAVWSNDLSQALRVAAALRAGQVIVNGGRTGVETPFGGFNASGWGREKGFEALNGYTRLKATSIFVAGVSTAAQ